MAEVVAKHAHLLVMLVILAILQVKCPNLTSVSVMAGWIYCQTELCVCMRAFGGILYIHVCST